MTELDDWKPDAKGVTFVPIGGAGEFGQNLSLYGHAGKWIMVDCGMGFGDERTPGVDLLVPDPAFAVERREDILGLVLTHAHEDHIGAIPYLWPKLRLPIYATPFTAAVVRMKLIEHGLIDQVKLIEIPLRGSFELGPFKLTYVHVTHSVPEPTMLVVETKIGRIVHTGDWKLDPGPVIGPVSDSATLKQLGDDGVLAVVGDSTNALTPGRSGSEAALEASFTSLFKRFRGRIAVACFSSNVARVEVIARAAHANDRDVALVGRSLWRIADCARETGYLANVDEFLSDSDAGLVPNDKIVLICTGSQGEPRSAMARIANEDHPQIDLQQGDTVIFSARAIPGNERPIQQLQSKLAKRGIEVVTPEHDFVHVSGHPAEDELTELYQWLRPRTVVPVHGEFAHLSAHAQLARDCQVPQTLIPENGTVIRFTADQDAQVIGQLDTNVLAVDGKRLVPASGGVLRQRSRMIDQGAIVVTIVLDGKGRLLAKPQVAAPGLLTAAEDQNLLKELSLGGEQAFDQLGVPEKRDDDLVRDAVRLGVRRRANQMLGKKPNVDVHLVRVQ
ncbi:ribonuclease J [Roseiterribacter gracilis]|uniref:MBL fold hydrolase n=1 Tax=Roseiterribacter gracilis TaxID=2812848 RepID=A0A8S8X9C7_9PROT|nr:MBL fold hydrolase [Rhodospirillales bacterium TMPK1]